VSRLGRRAAVLRPVLWGLTVGLMGVASVVGLLLPAFDHGSAVEVLGGLAAGGVFLALTRRAVERRDVHVGKLRGAGVRTAVLVFVVLLVHSLPEGFAIGTAYASETAGLSLFVLLAIGLQNVPEGTSVAIPMDAAGFTPGQQFWAAVATSAPQPIGAVGAYLLVEQVRSLLAISFGFAAGAMLAIVAVELMPRAFASGGRREAAAGCLAGAALMAILAVTLGV
jgi:ZIP family zinc transporter